MGTSDAPGLEDLHQFAVGVGDWRKVSLILTCDLKGSHVVYLQDITSDTAQYIASHVYD